MPKNIFYIFITISLFFTFSLSKEVDLILNSGVTLSKSMKNSDLYLDKLLIEAFKRINKSIHIVKKPAERSLKDTNEGRGDGEFLRVSGLSRIYPNLIQVPEEIFQFDFVAFSKRNDIKIEKWDSLTKYHVGIIIGWKILEENIKKTDKRYSFAEPELMFKLLENDKLDLVVYSRYLGNKIINELGYSDISVIPPPLAVRPMYLYLHKKHKKLVPQLVESLKSMKKDGTFQKLKDKYFLKI